MRSKRKISISLLFVVAAFHAISLRAESTKHLGVVLPSYVKKIDTNRFLSSRSYDDTKKDFLALIARSTMKKTGDEIDLPHVRAFFIENSDKNSLFYKINVYLNVQTGLTEIFFVVN